MDATVFLSSVTMSASARSESVSGFTCSTENCSAGINPRRSGCFCVEIAVYQLLAACRCGKLINQAVNLYDQRRFPL